MEVLVVLNVLQEVIVHQGRLNALLVSLAHFPIQKLALLVLNAR